MRFLIFLTVFVTLYACGPSPDPATGTPEASQPAESAAPAKAESLAGVLAAQPEEVSARFRYRHPEETLTFFDIQPGMTVVEALPGRGWYSKILLPVLGPEGKLIGANYAQAMWPMFGLFDDEFIESMKTWVDTWPAEADGWRGDSGAPVDAFVLGSLPPEMHGTADAVLFIRALHNLARFEGDGGYLTAALRDAFDVLKSGGIVGVVQHHARDEMPDEWADGSRGYLKKSFVIEMMEGAGFEFVDSSEINANDKDQPSQADIVWRLPPTLATSGDDAELRAELEAIGESNRMTLRFRKP